MRTFGKFLRDEDGLATIEWVALAAVAFIAAVGIAGILMNGADALGGAVATQMSETASSM
jgi:Flp pilus assembly pilin Flp